MTKKKDNDTTAELFPPVQPELETFSDKLVKRFQPAYRTPLGACFAADSLALLKSIPEKSVNLVMTSPPYALHFKKAYGNADKHEYLEWIIPFAKEIHRILKDDGSFVLNLGGSYNQGTPTKSLYQFKVLIALVEEVGFHLAQDCFWFNPAKMPVPAEWVTVRRIRIKDSVEYVWWLGKTAWPKADNRKVLKEYSADMYRLISRGIRQTVRPGGHVINESFAQDRKGAIPANVIEEQFPDSMLKFGNNAANDQYTLLARENGLVVHPARFPAAMPEFFIKLCTDENDIVLDPFSGSNTAGATAERLNRRWIASDLSEEYVEGSQYRFSYTSRTETKANVQRKA